MNYYVDILIAPIENVSTNQIMNKLFNKFHIALVEHGYSEIGISFPKADHTIGNHLRLHGSLIALERILNVSWFKGFEDYINISNIKLIPDIVKHRVVKRMQSKSNAERLRRRSVLKGWLTQEEADLKILDKSEKKLPYPYLSIKSHSSDQPFKLFIYQGPVVDKPNTGTFSSYGLSSTSTVPWF